MIKRLKRILLSITPVILVFIGCAAVSVNHFQDGKSLGKNNTSTYVGVNTGLSFVTTETELDDGSYVVETDILTNTPFLNAFIRHGIKPRLDVGAEVFTSLGSTGFQGFAKYALLDSLSKMGVAIMPVIGFTSPWFVPEEDEESSEVQIVGRTLILELALPMSYHPSNNLAFTFGPQFYFHHNYAEQCTGENVHIEREGKGTYMSPGFSFGIHYKKVRFGATLVKIQDNSWLPFAGFALSTDVFTK